MHFFFGKCYFVLEINYCWQIREKKNRFFFSVPFSPRVYTIFYALLFWFRHSCLLWPLLFNKCSIFNCSSMLHTVFTVSAVSFFVSSHCLKFLFHISSICKRMVCFYAFRISCNTLNIEKAYWISWRILPDNIHTQKKSTARIESKIYAVLPGKKNLTFWFVKAVDNTLLARYVWRREWEAHAFMRMCNC